MTRKVFLKNIREANQRITKRQREEIWSAVSGFFEKPTFYQIISGSSISEKNMVYGQVMLKKMKDFAAENKRIVNT